MKVQGPRERQRWKLRALPRVLEADSRAGRELLSCSFLLFLSLAHLRSCAISHMSVFDNNEYYYSTTQNFVGFHFNYIQLRTITRALYILHHFTRFFVNWAAIGNDIG